MLQSQIIKHFIKCFDHIQSGSIRVTFPDGKTRYFEGKSAGASADITVNDARAISIMAQKGEIGFAETFRDGMWSSSDLSALFLFCMANEDALYRYTYGNMLTRIASRFAYIFNRNSVKGSKRNIHAHYDLGNSFYELWLDPTMTYSSAIFENDTVDLMTAQQHKYDRIIERLDNSGRLLEIGCGWGGFAERAMQNRDYNIKGLTISQEQFDYATQRLNDKATIAMEDYRFQDGTYDQIVSIEMFEAVGEQFWPVYFSKMKSLLAANGKAMVQTITIEEKNFEYYRKGVDSIRSFIFPGGMLPSPERFTQASQTAGLRVTDRFAFGLDYAKTLQHWLDTFNAKIDRVKALGFDDKFIRMWRFYLTYCIAGFTEGRINVMQMELQHAA